MKTLRLQLVPALLLLASAASAGGDPPAGSAAGKWGAEYFPNVPLITHEGKTVHFFDDLIAGKVVVVNFIYTSCPDACPLETAKLAEVHGLLGERVGQDVFMYSISIDPERDTPEVLRDYTERFQTGKGWTFLTGAKEDITFLRQKLGMIRSGEVKLSDHTMSLLIGNQATGVWMKRSPMENPYLLATQIGSWLHNWKLPPEPGHDYANAPELRSLSRGENLFRTRCGACHGIGAEDALVRQGPDLLGVTERRERAWLARWLAEPDVMLAEKDPLAMELFEAYRRVPMPNMRLGPVEVEAVLEYMQDESRRIADERASAAEWEDDWEDAPEEEAGDGAEDGGVPSCCQKRDLGVLGSDVPGSEVAGSAELGSGRSSAQPDSGTEAPVVEPALPESPAGADRARAARTETISFPTSSALAFGLTLVLGLFAFALGRGGHGPRAG